MSEDTSNYGDKKTFPPANKTPADGTYDFYIFKLNEWATGRTAKGNGYVKVTLSAKCGARVTAKFFTTPKAASRAIDFIKACSGVTVSPSEISNETDLAKAISDLCCGKRVSATIKRGKDNEFNGNSYASYDVGAFVPSVSY